MNTDHPDVPWLGADFFENQRKFPPEELDKYAGRHIAWSWDGTRILADGADQKEVYDNVVAAGFNPSRVVFDYIEVL